MAGEESYHTYVVDISMDQHMLGNIGEKDKSVKRDTVLLKILQQGKNITLLSYTDDLKQRLYVLQNDETVPAELLNSIYYENGQVREEKQYHAMLLALAKKYVPADKETEQKINNTDYSAKAVANICLRINGLKKEDITNNSKERPSRFRFFAGAGINQGILKVTGANHFAGKNSSPSYFPVAGGGVDIFVNPAVGKMFLRTEIYATAYKTDAYAVVKYFEATENYYFKFRQVNVSLHSQLNYNVYNQPGFKWFIGGGAGFNFSSYPKNQQIYIREALTGTTTTVDDDYLDLVKKFWLNAVFRSGFVIKQLELSVSFFPRSSTTKYADADVTNTSLQLRINYLFR